MTTHTDACQLIESVSELARLGWAVKHRASQGAVEFTLADLEEIAHALTHADLAHAVDKGGDTLDGPIVLSDEPTGDAMRWTGFEAKCPVDGCDKGEHSFVKVDLESGTIMHLGGDS